jgi:hypothetical protein
VNEPDSSGSGIDWESCTFEGAEREQLRRWSRLPLRNKLQALEEMCDHARATIAWRYRKGLPYIDPSTRQLVPGRVVVREEPSEPDGPGEKDSIPAEWREEFEAAARRPLQLRMRYAFIHTYKPVLDDAPYRSWDSTADYRSWCERNLPDWLGYGGV